MVTIDIEYCVPCRLLDPAIAVQRELLERFGRDLEAVRLTTGHGGVFVVRADGEVIFDKSEHGNEIDVEAVVEAVNDRVASEA